MLDARSGSVAHPAHAEQLHGDHEPAAIDTGLGSLPFPLSVTLSG